MGPDIHGMKDMDRDVAEGDELDNDDGSTSAGVCPSSTHSNTLLSWCPIL